MRPDPLTPVPLDAGTTNPHFPLVDGVRALAALSIVVFHCGFFSGFSGDNALGLVVSRLDVGVAVFFVVTGFLLYRPWVAARAGTGRRPSLRNYAIGRALRILPAYWLALSVMAATSLILPLDGRAWELYALIQPFNADLVIAGIAPAWTLSVEMTFYVLLPLWASWIRPRWKALAALAAFGLAGRYLAVDNRPDIWQRTLPAFALWFAIGMGVAILSVRGAFANLRGWVPWTLAGAALALTFPLTIPRELSTHATLASDLAEHVLFGLIGALVIAPAVFGAQRRDLVRRFLGSRVMHFLGTISYGIFLWHFPLMLKLDSVHAIHTSSLHMPVLLAATTGSAIVAAWLSYRLVEAPALTLKTRLRARRPRPS